MDNKEVDDAGAELKEDGDGELNADTVVAKASVLVQVPLKIRYNGCNMMPDCVTEAHVRWVVGSVTYSNSM